jgi:hypothetical protein
VLRHWFRSEHARRIDARPALKSLDAVSAIALLDEFVTAVRSRNLKRVDALLAPRLEAVMLGRAAFRRAPVLVRMNRVRYMSYMSSWLSRYDPATYAITVDEVLSASPDSVSLSTLIHFPGNAFFAAAHPEPPRCDVTVCLYRSRAVFLQMEFVPVIPNYRLERP